MLGTLSAQRQEILPPSTRKMTAFKYPQTKSYLIFQTPRLLFSVENIRLTLEHYLNICIFLNKYVACFRHDDKILQCEQRKNVSQNIKRLLQKHLILQILQNQSIKTDQCHTEEAKSYLSGLEENGRSACKGKWGLKLRQIATAILWRDGREE